MAHDPQELNARVGGPLHEYVIASRLRRYRPFHRALLLLRVPLFVLLLAYRARALLGGSRRSCIRVEDGERPAGRCRFNGELEVVALFCELSFCVFFLLSIFFRWFLVERVTYPDRLLQRAGELPAVDVFVTTADPCKEPPLIIVNTVLSVLTLDYPTDKLACYVSDDGGSLLTLWSLKETIAFAENSWKPFCTKFSPHVQPRAPGRYFSRKANLDIAIKYGFSDEWLGIKEKYQALEAKVSSMTAAYCKSKNDTLKTLLKDLMSSSSTSDYGQSIYSSWALSYDPCNHSSYCEILVDKPTENSDMALPYLVYLSREKQPNKKHHYKAGAMNSLLRVSGIMTNAPFVMNLDCDMYVNEAKCLLQAMCMFMEDKGKEGKEDIGFVQFPQCFESLDEDDIYGNSMGATIEILLKGMDGVQGPAYCGTGTIHKRDCLYSKLPPSNSSRTFGSDGQKLSDMFGQSQYLILNVEKTLVGTELSIPYLTKDALLMECNALMNCDYEEQTSWGNEVGVLYGSVAEDLLTGTKEHAREWKSMHCMPCPPAFLGCAPSNSEDVLTTRKRWSMGMLEVLFSSISPLVVKKSKGLSNIQRCLYIQIYGYVLVSIPTFIYLLLPALSIITGKQALPKVVEQELWIPMSLALCMYMTSIYENKVVGIGLKQWWNSERMETIVAVSSNMFASYEILKKKIMGLSTETTFTVTPKNKYVPKNAQIEDSNNGEQESELGFVVNSKLPLFIPPTLLVIYNVLGLLFALVYILHNTLPFSMWPITEVVCSLWILFMFYPFTKGLLLWFLHQHGPLSLSSPIVLTSFAIIVTSFALIFSI